MEPIFSPSPFYLHPSPQRRAATNFGGVLRESNLICQVASPSSNHYTKWHPTTPNNKLIKSPMQSNLASYRGSAMYVDITESYTIRNGGMWSSQSKTAQVMRGRYQGVDRPAIVVPVARASGFFASLVDGRPDVFSLQGYWEKLLTDF